VLTLPVFELAGGNQRKCGHALWRRRHAVRLGVVKRTRGDAQISHGCGRARKRHNSRRIGQGFQMRDGKAAQLAAGSGDGDGDGDGDGHGMLRKCVDHRQMDTSLRKGRTHNFASVKR
jgi:hypothetical protein